jgi:hypothetical protein
MRKRKWSDMVAMTPHDRAQDFLDRIQDVPPSMIKGGVIRVLLPELYKTLYSGVPTEGNDRRILTRSLRNQGIISSNNVSGKGAVWMIHSSPVQEDVPVVSDEPSGVCVPESVYPGIGDAWVVTGPDNLDTALEASQVVLAEQTRTVRVLGVARIIRDGARLGGLDEVDLDEAVRLAKQELFPS